MPFLEALLHGGHQVPLVVTQPDRPSGRSRRPQSPPVKLCAQENSLEVYQPRAVRKPRFLEKLRSVSPDILVVVAYGRILPVPVIEAFRYGAVNVHFSLLPRFRGAAPVQWCLARGEKVTGVTTMVLSEGMDEGDILLQQDVAVEPGEHAPALQARLIPVGAALLMESLRRLEGGDLEPTPQQHHLADRAPMLKRSDGEIPPDLSAVEIEGRVRGFDPWPGVWLSRKGKRIRLLEVREAEGLEETAPPGRITGIEGGALVMACGGGTRLAIEMLQPEGRKAVNAGDAVNGRTLIPGDDLEQVRSRG